MKRKNYSKETEDFSKEVKDLINSPGMVKGIIYTYTVSFLVLVLATGNFESLFRVLSIIGIILFILPVPFAIFSNSTRIFAISVVLFAAGASILIIVTPFYVFEALLVK